ncbi:methyl-accepting chemotaxis protein [Paenibacillus pasadenensis]|uniref:methyl-accepting chemotaxis protein n=1 Tax=Paenibacillus pasadenensis TaxID=217090 RepID=UPI00203E7FA6|nr:methyl-accepting chemotaxis protein [Paenibacillus pasadenensis]MCM3746635.1 methyl-accepting chemotaxis protein [Paenibacillus pasadenensis]
MRNPFQGRLRKQDGAVQKESASTQQPVMSKGFGRQGGNPLNLMSVRLFLIVFISIIACVSLVGVLSYRISKDVIEEKVTDSTVETVNQLRGKVDLILESLENYSMQFFTDKALQTNLNNLAVVSTEEYAWFENQQAINDRLAGLALSNSNVINVNLIPVGEKAPKHVLGTGSLIYDTFKDAPWLKQAKELNGKPLWIPMQKNGFQKVGDPAFGLARAINLTSSGNAYVLLIEIKESVLLEQFQDMTLGDNSRVQLVDNDNKIMIDSLDETLVSQTSSLDFGDVTEGNKITDSSVGQVLAVFESLQHGGWDIIAMIPTAELVKDAKKIERTTWIVAFGAALLAILVGIYVIYSIGRPLRQMKQLMGEAMNGNLTVRSDMRSKSEIGQLAGSFNEMMERITELILQTRGNAKLVLVTAEEVGDASRRTAGAAREIAVATEEIAGGATSLAMEAERGSDLTGSMDLGMRKVKASNDDMRSSAEQVETASREGTEHMAAMIQKTGETEQMVRSMTEKVERLKESTRSIRKILDVLGSVAKQTNILSLNASIEAARAGAAGKGFMVVAGEIRELAEQSRQSIHMVEGITNTIQTEIEETVEALGKAQPIFQEQIGSVKEANGIFLEVQARMGALTLSLENVSESVRILDESQQQLSEAMGSVSAVAEEASATSEEVASLSSEQLGVSESLVSLSGKLEDVSKSLQKSLDRFQVKQE